MPPRPILVSRPAPGFLGDTASLPPVEELPTWATCPQGFEYAQGMCLRLSPTTGEIVEQVSPTCGNGGNWSPQSMKCVWATGVPASTPPAHAPPVDEPPSLAVGTGIAIGLGITALIGLTAYVVLKAGQK